MTEVWNSDIPKAANVILSDVSDINENLTYLYHRTGYMVDSSESDQGAAGGGRSLYDLLTSLGTSKEATIFFPHLSEDGDTTIYTFTDDYDVSSYTNIRFIIQRGAILRITAAKTLTFYRPEDICAGPYQIFDADGSTYGSIAFDKDGSVFGSWWGSSATGAVTPALPTAGAYLQGDIVFNRGVSAGEALAWVNVSAGSPGTFVSCAQAGYRTNSGSPSGSVTPYFIGEELLDTTNNVWYKAHSTTNTSWNTISETRFKKVTLTNVNIKALNATPVELVAAPGANFVIVFNGAMLKLNAGTEVLTESADNLVIEYDNGSAVACSNTIEATGFIDQAADTITNAIPVSDMIDASADIVNKNIAILNSGDGEYGGNATGDATMDIYVYYNILYVG